MRPGRFAGRGGHPVGVESAADLSDGGAGGPVGEDPPHHDCFRFVDLPVRRPGRRAARDAPIAVGGLPGGDLSGAGSEQLAPPVPFGDLRLLVFGDHALDLSEQGGLRIIRGQGWGIGEGQCDSEPGQLVEDQNLVGVGPGQPVRREAPHPLEQPAFGAVTQRVQPGPVQPGSGVAVVEVLTDQFVPRFGHVLTQQLQLGTDGAPFGLPLGRDPGIQRRPHRGPRPASDTVSGPASGTAVLISSKN